VPLRAETRTICQTLAVDPYRLISSGAMLISTPAGPLESLFAEKGIPLTPIGEFLVERRFILNLGNTQQEGVPEVHEELWRVLEERHD
jgi:hydrogenase expression/formation protein HypE